MTLNSRNLHNTGYRVLGNFPLKFFPFPDLIKRFLSQGELRISHVIYISSMTFWSIVASILTVTIAFPITLILNLVLQMNLSIVQVLLTTVGATIGVGLLVFILFIYYPLFRASGIKSGIDKSLVYIINYMSILAGAGVTSEDIFLSLSETGDTYRVDGSAKSVVRDIEILGKDIVTAISDEGQNTPSKEYSRVLRGFVGTIRSGGDLKVYLAKTAERQMQVRRRKLTSLVSQLNLAAEAYIILGIAFPIILTTLLSLMGIFGGEIIGGLGPIEIMNLMTYLFFPLASIGVIILIDGVTSSW